MKLVLLFIACITIVTSSKLEFFKVSFPPESGLAKLDFKEATWIQNIPATTWSDWRFDLYVEINTKVRYDKIISILPNLSKFLNCNMIVYTNLRCIFLGSEIVLQKSRQVVNDTIYYMLEIKNTKGTTNASIEFKIVENAMQETAIIDSIIAKQDPDL